MGEPGRPVVRRAGISSPRSVATCVPVESVNCSTFHDVQVPVCVAGPASGAVTPPVSLRPVAPASGLSRFRSAAVVTQGAVR